MKISTFSSAAAWVGPAVFAFAFVFAVACDDDKKAKTDAGTDADTDTDTDSDTDADAGPDAGAFCDRGNPEDFPTDCFTSCEEACARLEECGGATAPGCPLSAEDCAAKCAQAMQGGYSWDDVSGHFRCCASQDECQDVEGCGGWLAHPDAIAPCEGYCECWESFHGIDALRARRVPPAGYDWARRAVAVLAGDETADYEARYGVEVMARGGVVFLREAEGARHGNPTGRIARGETVLPTFVDARGRVAAANGRVIIEATDPTAIDTAMRLAADRGFTAAREIPWSKGRLRVVESADPWSALDLLPELDAVRDVRAELDMIRIYERRYEPDDARFGEQWHLLNVGQADPAIAGGTPLSIESVDSRVAEAWDVTMGDSSVVIAVLDDGVNLDHPDLAPNLTAEPYNYPDNWEDYMGAPYSGDVIGSHGTSCAGVAAARGDNEIGVAGVCPTCTLLPGLIWDKTLHPTDPEQDLPFGGGLMMSDEACAGFFVDLVDLGAWIISNSWGLGGEDPQFEGSVGAFPALPTVLGDAFDYAEEEGRDGLGTLIVFAAGNSNMDVTTDPYLSHPNVVGVAAVDDQGLKAYYSSFGATVDVAAPSNGGLNGITTVEQSADAGTDPHYTNNFGGTSSATPFVAGALGLILSINSTLTAAQARQILTDSAGEIDPVWGEWSSGFSPFYGSGLVNAYTAVRMAANTCSDPTTCAAPSDECASDCDGTACDPCRTDLDCADGWRCQALPALGAQVCVEAVASDTCQTDFSYVGGFCLPSRAACGLCAGAELCNGRDDDCDGQVDDELVDCAEAGRCLQEGWGCPTNAVCAATICIDGGCEDASDCATGEECVHVKTRYGDIDTESGLCRSSMSTGCIDRCVIRDSSGLDEEMAAFAECIDEMETCSYETLNVCRELLPASVH